MSSSFHTLGFHTQTQKLEPHCIAQEENAAQKRTFKVSHLRILLS